MTVIEIKYNDYKGHMTINLDELFYPNKLTKEEKTDIVHFTTWGRAKKVLELLIQWEYCNRESYSITLEYIKGELSKWFKFCKMTAENLSCQRLGSDSWKKYTHEYEENERKFKLFNNALNLLERTDYTLQDRVRLFKEAIK